MNFRLPSILLFILLATGTASGLAPANDDCSTAFTLTNVSNYCSSPSQFTNVAATPSGLDRPFCFPVFDFAPVNDVWFKFTAIANTVNISVLGAMSGVQKGSLKSPQFALYRGDCSKALVEMGCISDAQGYNIAETFITDLAIGGTYYIRVDGRNGNTGSFQLCVNNFSPVPSPSSDCSTAVVLCDKSPFTVPSISGVGFDRNEVPPGFCLESESSSAWYKWTCDKPGTLTFTLKPVNPADDIDFALFLLPYGVDDCSMKIPVRCMASGEQVSAAYSSWARCSGTTGLRFSSADAVEHAGCDEGDDNYVAGISMEAGQSYALLVNNFHNTGNGFSIDFGGSGTFKGPEAHFVVNKLKIQQEQELWLSNRSSFEGGIKTYEWNFGVDAKPASAKGIGPHKVMYSSSGVKSISLVIETENGCKVTKVRQVTVTDPPAKPKEEPKPEPPIEEEPIVASTDDKELVQKPVEELVEKSPVAKPPAPKRDTVVEAVSYDVKYTASIYFKSDSSSLEPDGVVILKKVLLLLKQNPDYKAIVEGHTNSIPDTKYCNKLASDRADAVIFWLNENGIEDDRIIRKVFGKDKVREKEDKKYKNRRVHQKAVVRLVQRE